jgi:ANTAR domain/GAF domain
MRFVFPGGAAGYRPRMSGRYTSNRSEIRPSASAGAGGADPLASIVDQLRAERDGLRDAMRTRAIIEQAKGILMARFRLTPEEAFTRLRRASQRSNVRLAEVAAMLVASVARPAAPEPRPADPPATAQPVPVSSARRRAEVGQHPPAAAARTRCLLIGARLDAATTYDEIVSALADVPVAWPPPSSVVLALTDPDGALRVAASAGLPGEMASQWARIPPQVDVPLTRAAHRRETVWLADQAAVAERFPVVEAVAPGVSACVAVPLIHDGALIGAVGFTWREALGPIADQAAYLGTVTEAAARAAVRVSAPTRARAAPGRSRRHRRGSGRYSTARSRRSHCCGRSIARAMWSTSRSSR